jgi:hypothetical protein
MGYQRDMRIQRQAKARLAGCIGCRDIQRDGISFTEHTCGQKFEPAHGVDFDLLDQLARQG